MAFYVGQKVVCVDDGPYGFHSALAFPLEKGGVYVVRGIVEIEDRNGNIGIQVCGYEASVSYRGHYAFSSSRFRPLVENKSGIEILNRIRLGGKPDGFEEPKRRVPVDAENDWREKYRAQVFPRAK